MAGLLSLRDALIPYACPQGLSNTGLAQTSGPAEDPVLALSHGDPLAVEVLEEGDGVLAAHAEQILDAGGADLLVLPEIGDEGILDAGERLGVEVEALLDPDQAPVGHEDLV